MAKRRQHDNLETSPALPAFLTVREFAHELRLHPRDAYEYLPDIPGVIKLGPRRTRIPRAGLNAWLRKLEVSQK